jgi:hypothetical protein
MCVKCVTPGTEEYDRFHEYLRIQQLDWSEETILKSTGSMVSALDEIVYSDPEFNPDTDLLIDGVHAKAKRKWAANVAKRKPSRTPKRPKAELDPHEQLVRTYCKRLEREYNQLPEPRPDYVDWSLSQPSTRQMMVRQMLSDALASPKPEQRTRAQAQALEFSKVKPKKVIESREEVPIGDLPNLMRQITQLAGIPSEAAEAFIGTYFGHITQSN